MFTLFVGSYRKLQFFHPKSQTTSQQLCSQLVCLSRNGLGLIEQQEEQKKKRKKKKREREPDNQMPNVS